MTKAILNENAHNVLDFANFNLHTTNALEWEGMHLKENWWPCTHEFVSMI